MNTGERGEKDKREGLWSTVFLPSDLTVYLLTCTSSVQSFESC